MDANLISKDISALYDQAVSTLTSQGKFYINLGLERIGNLLELLGNPHDNLKIIHVAGTNGKGSTCAMLASILNESGYKTGLYTSPHLINYTERIKINGQDISQEDFAKLIFKIVELANANNIHITEFEILTAAAFIYFNEEKVDFVVLETGLGGRLDATNVIKSPLLSIITSIDIDHTDRLGSTIEQITFEKAGIIKEKIPIITLKDNKGIEIISKACTEKVSSLIPADYSEYKSENNSIITENETYELPLLGLWQLKNLSLVLKAIELLNNQNIFISKEAVKLGLKKTHWQGRFQYIKEKNLILDGAHNPSGAKLLRDSLDFYFPGRKIIWIYSSLNTKNYESIINILFKPDDVVICTKSSSQSSVSPDILKEKILVKNYVQKLYISDNVEKSIILAEKLMEKENITDQCLIVIAGSLYTIGEALKILINDRQF